MSAADERLLDEWRRPDRDVRIGVEWMTPLRDVSEQYVSPERSLRKLWTYFRRFGAWDMLRKVRSRLSESARNRKVAGFGFGRVIEAPAAGPNPGTPVCFFAPSAAADAARIVVDIAFVRPAKQGARPSGGPQELPEPLEPYLAWSSFSGVPLDAGAIAAGLDVLIADAATGSAPSPEAAVQTSVADARALPRRTPDKPAVAVFGLGNYAKQLIIPNIPPEMELVRVHEIDPRQLAGWGRSDVSLDTCPWPRDDERYDLWFVAGYHSTHAPIALTALKRGGAVAVEKPLATTRADLEALRDRLAAMPEARLFTCFQRRYADYNRWIREDLAAAPGSPIDYNCIVYEIPLSPLHWYGWPGSGGRIVSNGCHWIDHFMYLNDYAEVASATAMPGAHNGSTVLITLANGAEFMMRLTEIGSPRIGVRDHIEVSQGSRTATIRNAEHYAAEDASRTIRRRRVKVMTAYRQMYREICRRVLTGGPGDSLASLGSSFATVDLDAQLGAGPAAPRSA